jgi:uroporphyrinogen III methyltransferase / synthase
LKSDSGRAGTVYLVGAGPGDPGLITLRGRDIIARADVIVYDRLASPRLLRHARSDAGRVYVGKQSSRHTLTQDEINALIVEEALAGKSVCRLKGGDPFVYGRGGEEAEACRVAGVPFEIVPGITSAIAVPAYAGIPVTHRGLCSALGIITGHEDPGKPESALDWAGLAKGLDTLVFLMGVENLPNITRELLAHGRSPETLVALIRWGTTPDQQTITGTLADIVDRVREAEFKAPAVTVVGEVVGLRESLRWWDNRPLTGKTVVVTRSREQSSELSERLEALGAEALEFPTIRTQAIPEAAQQLATECLPLDVDWVLFTSANAVTYLLDALRANGEDIRALGRSRIGAIGPATAKAVLDLGLNVDFVPQSSVAEGVLEAFPDDVNGQTILIPRAEQAREVLPQELASRGASVMVLPVYRTVPDAENADEVRGRFERGEVDIVTFTSSSTVKNFHAALEGAQMDGVTVACIGPATAQTAEELGYSVHVLAKEFSVPGLVDALVEHLA